MRQYPLAVVFGLLLLPLTWPIDAMARTPSQSMVRDGINHTPKDKQKASDASRRKAVEAARRKAQQEAARRKAQEEARRKAQQDAARRKALEDARRKAQQEAARRKAQEEARRKAQQDAARRKAQEEDRRKAQQDAARRKVQEEARRKAQQDAARRKAQEEARRKAQQDAARRKAQEEARRKAQQDAARRKTQEESFRREPVQKTSGHRPAQFKPQPVPFKPRNQQPTEQGSSFSNKSNGAVQRPTHGAEWNPTSVKPSRKSKADLRPKPATNTNHGPWFLNSASIKNTNLSSPDTDEATTVCWWEPAPSPVIDIDIHFGSGSSCWTPVDHHHWWFGGGWHWHHHASTCHSFGWGFLCWSRPGCHTLGWRPWWDRPNCVEWWTPTWNWCSPSVHYVTLSPPPPPSSQQCWDALNYGDLGLARRDFLKRLAADPFDADSRLGLALCEGMRGNASGMQAELLRVLEDDPWICMSWRPSSLRDQLKGLLRDASRDAKRVDVPERWVVVGVLAAVAQEDGVALAGLQRAFGHPRAIPGAELLQRLIQDRQLAF